MLVCLPVYLPDPESDEAPLHGKFSPKPDAHTAFIPRALTIDADTRTRSLGQLSASMEPCSLGYAPHLHPSDHTSIMQEPVRAAKSVANLLRRTDYTEGGITSSSHSSPRMNG